MSISREVLAKYVKPGMIFVECGSRWGDTLIRAIECGAVSAFGCENDALYASLASAHLREACPRGNASVMCEPSTLYLRHDGYAVPSVVFLDAHTETHSPVLHELDSIARWNLSPRVILIDDMRCMEGWGLSKEIIISHLKAIADYKISFEDGVVPEDIMVAQL